MQTTAWGGAQKEKNSFSLTHTHTHTNFFFRKLCVVVMDEYDFSHNYVSYKENSTVDVWENDDPRESALSFLQRFDKTWLKDEEEDVFCRDVVTLVQRFRAAMDGVFDYQKVTNIGARVSINLESPKNSGWVLVQVWRGKRPPPVFVGMERVPSAVERPKPNMVILFGSTGMLGRTVALYFARHVYNYPLVLYDRSHYDAEVDGIEVLRKLARVWPSGSWVINALGRIPQKHSLSTPGGDAKYIRVNSVFPHLLQEVCSEADCQLVQVTTDCVYDGTNGPYAEGEPSTATSIYGISKSCGEPNESMVIRTSIIGEEFQPNARTASSSLSLLEWVRSHDKPFHKSPAIIYGYTNHYWNGITCLQFAKTLVRCIRLNCRWTGVKHVVSPTMLTKMELVKLIALEYKMNARVVQCDSDCAVNRVLLMSGNGHVDPFDIPELVLQLREQREFFFDVNSEF